MTADLNLVRLVVSGKTLAEREFHSASLRKEAALIVSSATARDLQSEFVVRVCRSESSPVLFQRGN